MRRRRSDPLALVRKQGIKHPYGNLCTKLRTCIAIAYRRLQTVDAAAQYRNRTLIAVGMRKQPLKHVIKAEPRLNVHETANKKISSYTEVNTNFGLSSKKAKLRIQYPSKHEEIGVNKHNRYIRMY